MALYIRTGNGGADEAVLIQDLGYVVPTGSSWKELTIGTSDSPADGSGQFTSYELRYSKNLYDFIKDESLEFSFDGVGQGVAAQYTPDAVVLSQYSDDEVSLQRVVVANLEVDGYSFTDHLDGGAGKHEASEIDVSGTYSNFSGNQDLASVLTSIDGAFSNSAGDAFVTVQADSGSIVADAVADTMTLAGSNGVSTSADAGSDTITIDGYNLLPRDGSRAMLGSLDMGDFDIVSVGLVDGRNVSEDGETLDSHLDGNSGKHAASEITVENTYENIGSLANDDLEIVLSGINTALSSANQAAFRTVTGDSGSVTADTSTDSIAILGSNGIVTLAAEVPESLTISGEALLPLDGSRAMLSNLNMDGYRVVGVADPVDDQDAANKSYVDSVALGLDFKQSVLVATTADIDLATGGLLTVDDVLLTAGDRVLVKDQADLKENGIYVVDGYAWVRAVDADNTPGSEVSGGMFCFVEDGSLYGSTGWVLASPVGDANLGVDDLTFVQFSEAGVVQAGDGLYKTGLNLHVGGTADRISVSADAVDIASTYAGQSSITTLGTISTGTWEGTAVAVAHGGTGATNAADARDNLDAAPNTASYLTLGTDSELTDERVLTEGTAISFADAGAGSTLTIAHAQVASGDLHTEYLRADGYRALSGDMDVNGVVTFDPSTSTDPAFVIVPDSAAPTTKVVDGAVSVVGGVLYAYDGTRSKWLSVDRKMVWAGRNANATNLYLRTVDSVATSVSGYRALRSGTITGLVAQTGSNSTWTLEIRKNGVTTPIASLSITTASGAQDATINVDFNAGDELEIFCNGSAVPTPVGGAEIAWRV